jgi:hypothetical protein
MSTIDQPIRVCFFNLTDGPLDGSTVPALYDQMYFVHTANDVAHVYQRLGFTYSFLFVESVQCPSANTLQRSIASNSAKASGSRKSKFKRIMAIVRRIRRSRFRP